MTIEEAIKIIKNYDVNGCGYCHQGGDEVEEAFQMAVQSLTAISELSKSLKAVNRYDMDEKVLIGFNMAVAIFNKCFGESCAQNEQSEQNVGMCQQNVGEMSEKQKYGEWIEVIDEIDSLGNKTWHHECSICGNRDSGWGDYKYCPNCGAKMAGPQESEDKK